MDYHIYRSGSEGTNQPVWLFTKNAQIVPDFVRLWSLLCLHSCPQASDSTPAPRCHRSVTNEFRQRDKECCRHDRKNSLRRIHFRSVAATSTNRFSAIPKVHAVTAAESSCQRLSCAVRRENLRHDLDFQYTESAQIIPDLYLRFS